MASAPKDLSFDDAHAAIEPQAENGRRLFVGIAVAFVTLLGVWIWGIRRADELPDVGEPFDINETLRPVAIDDADNAFVGYTQASRLQLKFPPSTYKVDFEKITWSKSSDAVRDFVTKSRPALEKLREASECPDAVYHQPQEMAADTMLPVVQDMRYLCDLAALEGSRLQDLGAMEEAWKWYRAILRTSRHLGRHGVLIERNIGAAVHNRGARRILQWAADPRVDARMLRLALDDTIAADAMTPPLSDNLKLEYLFFRRDFHELRVMVKDVPLPGGRDGWIEQLANVSGAKPQIQRIRLQATNDVERSRRAARLLFANWLAQIDKPALKRSLVAIRKPLLIYNFDPTSQAAKLGIDAHRLDQALAHTALANEVFRDDDPSTGRNVQAPWEGDGYLAREPKRRATLIIMLAAELYRREHGRPPSTAGALLEKNIKVLPDGIDPNDPIPAEFN